MMSVLSFGEIVWDIIDGVPHLGGAPLNFAVHIVKCGGKSSIISKVGNDKLGKNALEEVASNGVATELIAVDKHHTTGTVDVFLYEGQPDYKIHKDVAYDYINSSGLNNKMFDVLYFGSLAQRSVISRNTLYKLLDSKEFKYVFYDVNLRKDGYTTEVIDTSMHYANIVKMNSEEAVEISRTLFRQEMELPEFLHFCESKYHPEVILVTEGEKGCYVYKNHKMTHIVARNIELQDAVGAGDAFGAAFMATYFKNNDAIKAAEIANGVGGFVASRKGAIPEYGEEIRRLLKAE